MIQLRSCRTPMEPLSARLLRYRIARGYSASDLASAAGVWAGAIQRLESGRSVDKRTLAPLAAALGVPLCRLVCGEHSCAQRACVPASRLDAAPELPRTRGSGAFAFTTPLRRRARRRTSPVQVFRRYGVEQPCKIVPLSPPQHDTAVGDGHQNRIALMQAALVQQLQGTRIPMPSPSVRSSRS